MMMSAPSAVNNLVGKKSIVSPHHQKTNIPLLEQECRMLVIESIQVRRAPAA
jgi:hypothetical protein